jgi:phosphoribosyl-ATP pyrophosphohydrolase/phosphoribosyl-AMP cyclohydrolase
MNRENDKYPWPTRQGRQMANIKYQISNPEILIPDPQSLAPDLRWDERGLLPAIVQDAATGEVLTLAYMNAEALRLTLESGETWFWSRSRGELWHKGATSGNTQQVVELRYDCDGDALLLRVVPAGPACHTGQRSCFYRALSGAAGRDEA